LVLALAAFLTSVQIARADLHFVQPVVELGDVRGGMLVPRRFAFVNQGPETIEITCLRASCGCLKPRLETRVYKPGDKGELLVEINPLSQSGGNHLWTVQVAYCRGEEVREQTLKITGRIIAEVAVQPASLTMLIDHARQDTLTLTDVREQPLPIVKLQTTSTHLHVRGTEPTRDEHGHWVRTLTLEVDADFPEGRHEETLEIFSSDPEYREMRIPVTVEKKARQRFSVTPNPVRLNGTPGQAGPSRLLLVREREDLPVEIESVEVDDPAIHCEWSHGPSTPATVRVRLDPSRAAAGPQSVLHIHLSQPVRETVQVPILRVP
jgi:hypothetical protein